MQIKILIIALTALTIVKNSEYFEEVLIKIDDFKDELKAGTPLDGIYFYEHPKSLEYIEKMTEMYESNFDAPYGSKSKIP